MKQSDSDAIRWYGMAAKQGMEIAQDEINDMINDFRKDLFQVTCAKSGMLPETQKIMEDAYGVA